MGTRLTKREMIKYRKYCPFLSNEGPRGYFCMNGGPCYGCQSVAKFIPARFSDKKYNDTNKLYLKNRGKEFTPRHIPGMSWDSIVADELSWYLTDSNGNELPIWQSTSEELKQICLNCIIDGANIEECYNLADGADIFSFIKGIESATHYKIVK